jgi:hypothetical protein
MLDQSLEISMYDWIYNILYICEIIDWILFNNLNFKVDILYIYIYIYIIS